MAIEAFIFNSIKNLVIDAVKKQVNYQAESFFTKLKIERKLEDSVASVVEPLIPFFENEGIGEGKQSMLVEQCTDDLRPLIEDPGQFFAAGLDGQKVFERLYPAGALPQNIREEGLEHPYTLLFPRIAHLVCSFPPALKAWEAERYHEEFRRLDEIVQTLGEIGKKVDALAVHGAQTGDFLLARFQQTLVQRVEFQLELTSLRADQPYAGRMEDLFVVPQLMSGTQGAQVVVENRAETIARFVDQQVRAVVNGPPGAGKSTWLLWLQRLFLEQPDGRVAILIRLRDYAGAKLPSLHEMIRSAAGTHMAEEFTAPVLRAWLDSGRLTFLFDGFDEIAPAHRDAMVDWIEDFAQAAYPANVVLTSRPLTTDHLEKSLEGWERWQILPFDFPRILEYIDRWYRSAPLLEDAQRKVDASALANTWNGDPALNHLTGNPLMLSTLLMVNHLDGELPKGRAKLYERYITGMLGLWDRKRNISLGTVEIATGDKRRILAKIALHLQLRNEDQIGEENLRLLTQQILRDLNMTHLPVDVLRILVERSGLLVGPGQYSFVHKSVGEFLVAEVIFHGNTRDPEGRALDRLRLFEERYNDRWNTVLFFWAGLTASRDLQEFIEQCSAISTDADLLLAIGLIYDQLEKLDFDFARRQLLALYQHGLTSDAYEITNLSHVPLADNRSVRIDTNINVRGLSNILLYHAAWSLYDLLDIRWSSVADSHDSVRPMLWIAKSHQYKDMEDYRDLLTIGTPAKMLGKSWNIAACQSALHPFWRGERIHLSRPAIEMVKQIVPEVIGIIPLILLSDHVFYGFAIYHNQASGFDAVESCRHEFFSEQALKATKSMDIPGASTRDLLEAFAGQIKKAVEEGYYPDGERTQGLFAYIEDLRTHREILIANQPQE